MLCLLILLSIWGLLSYLYSLITTNPWFLFLWIPLGFISTLILFIAFIYLVIVPIFIHINPNSKFKIYYTRHLCKFLCLICGGILKVEGEENICPHKRVLVVSNHKSKADPFFIYIALKKGCTVAGKADLWRVKLLLPIIKAFHAIKIDRSSDRESAKSIIEGIKIMKNDESVIIFPEGGIKSREVEQMVSLKAGAYKLATKSDAYIQPIAIIGTSQLSKRKFYQFFKITVRILPYISPEEYKDLSTQEIGHKVIDMVNANFIHEKEQNISVEE